MNAFISTLPRVLDAIEASDEVRDAFVFAAWRSVAGERTSQRTRPVAVDGRRLIVAVSDKTWKRNLETLASQLLYKLNAAIGMSSIDMIEFRVDPESVDFAPAAQNNVASDLDSLPPEIAISAGSIRDRELRKTVLAAAANCLARKE